MITWILTLTMLTPGPEYVVIRGFPDQKMCIAVGKQQVEDARYPSIFECSAEVLEKK
jgi:hypothetical protein